MQNLPAQASDHHLPPWKVQFVQSYRPLPLPAPTSSCHVGHPIKCPLKVGAAISQILPLRNIPGIKMWKLCICEMWMAWDLRPPFASVWPWPNPISPIIRTVHHDPARRRNPYGILPLWCNPPKIKEPPIMTQTHPHHFEIPQKKILMSYISSIDYNSTVVQIFVGHRKFQLAKCKLHLTMNRIVVYTYSIITQE